MATRRAAALERCVGDTERFLADTYGRAPHHERGGDLAGLFTLDDADTALSGHGLRRPAVRLVRDGEVLDPAGWTRGARTGATRVDDLVHPGRALEALGDGATIVFQSMQRWWPPLQGFGRELELALGQGVQANAYLSPAGTRGLVPHHDTHDVFVIQTHRSKDWTLRAPVTELPLRRQRSDHDAAAAQAVHREVTLEPGDCLYLPRGWVHSARASEGISLHVTVGILATTMRDVMSRVLDRAADELVSLRRALPRHGSDADVTAAVELATSDLAEWLATVDHAGVAAAESERFVAGRPPALAGQLIDLDRLPGIDDRTRVRPRGPAVVGVDETERLVVRTGDRRISLPLAARAAVERLLTAHDGIGVAELSDLVDQQSRLVLVRRLVREGVLAVGDPR